MTSLRRTICWPGLMLVGLFSLAPQAWAATVNASSCSANAVSAAINSASAGDTVQVPAGSCSWSGLNIRKAVHLRGAGIGASNIRLTGNNNITKQSNGVVRISRFSFTKNGGGNGSKGLTVTGSWRNAEPVIIEDNTFNTSGSGLMRLEVAGGVIIAGNDFRGDWGDSFIQPKEAGDSGNSWGTADTIGSRDTTGKLNLYVENNTMYGATNAAIDCDDSARCVFRHNTLTYSSFNSHGQATSSIGMRHFEVYNNRFIHNGGSGQIANQNWAVWIRGATGVIFGNEIDDLAGDTWGNKRELHFSIRGAEDNRPQGSCSNTRYPAPRQVGQNHDGNNYFTDPVYIWGNTGATQLATGFSWGNPCGFSFSTFFSIGRDLINSGQPKPGYTPYTYPHPLTNGGTAPSIPAPTNLREVN